MRLWGIGAKTPNRLSLAPGDRVLIYVGAPEYEFIGHAELGSATHDWTPAEATQYPGSFGGGVTFSQAEVWAHPVPMKSVLPKLALKETNPGAHFFSGVVRVTKTDYETVVAAGTGKAPLPKPAELVGSGTGTARRRRPNSRHPQELPSQRVMVPGRPMLSCCSRRSRS